MSVDTIYALSSGGLPAGVAVIRLSGRAVTTVVERLFGRVPSSRRAEYGSFRDDAGLQLDRGLCLYFAGPASFTGEDCAEFHLHGGRAVVAAMFNALQAFPGLRHAEAGEFTKRAFLNSKIDLTESEGLADLVEAETEAQRRFALTNAGGAQKRLYDGWRDRVVHARAMIEAELDFADESDVPGSVAGNVWQDIERLEDEVERHLAGFHAAEIVRAGYQVVLLGPPNAGKSSLLNALAKRDVAIVSDEPGTTRDLIEVALDLNGTKVVVTDTAGVRDRPGHVERIGIDRALERASQADMILVLKDPLGGQGDLAVPSGPRHVRVGTKSDLGAGPGEVDLDVSAHTGDGLAALIATIAAAANEAVGARVDTLPARSRHVELLQGALKALRRSLRSGDLELRAEELRLAGDAIGRITGRIDVEDLLDVIFSRFCIGK